MLAQSFTKMISTLVLFHVLLAPSHHHQRRHFASAFSSSSGDSPTAGFDRFRAECPASPASIALFNPSLVGPAGDDERGEDGGETFVAVYRSANNLPSVIMRDDLFASMRIATTTATTATTAVSEPADGIETKASNGSSSSSSSGSNNKKDNSESAAQGSSGVEAPVPLAVGRLRPSPDFEGSFVIDDLRCSLKKEDTNPDCDGGSEHTEALGVCIDELILHRLRLATACTSISKKGDGGGDGPAATTAPASASAGGASFDGALRCKATLVSSPLLCDRGFEEIDEFPLPSDMATHVSGLDSCMERFADRVVGAGAKNIGARERALKILSLLGQLNREEGKKAKQKKQEGEKGNNESGDDEYDPWANVNLPGQWGR